MAVTDISVPNADEMVISVPHSGTRTLKEHLGLSGYWHFGMNDPDIELFTGHAHIPIRDPFDIAVSWESRYDTEEIKGAKFMMSCFERMIEYTRHRADTTFHKIEDLSIQLGKGPKHWARDRKRRKDALDIDRIRELRGWMQQESVHSFYTRFYPKGFWWV